MITEELAQKMAAYTYARVALLFQERGVLTPPSMKHFTELDAQALAVELREAWAEVPQTPEFASEPPPEGIWMRAPDDPGEFIEFMDRYAEMQADRMAWDLLRDFTNFKRGEAC